MKLTRLVYCALGLICADLVCAQEPAPAEPSAPAVKNLDESPDGKFAMRVRYDTSAGPMDEGTPGAVQAIDLVSLSSEEVAATLMPFDAQGVNFRELNLVWSADSNWVAFYYSYPRVGYTTVLKRQGSKFVETAKPETLMTQAESAWEPTSGSRNEYVNPIRWTKPGTLLLRQFSLLRGKHGKSVGVKYDLTAVLDPRTGKLKQLKAVPRDD